MNSATTTEEFADRFPPAKILSLVLWGIAGHSLLVGIGLFFLPATLMHLFGFGQCYERFFPMQGGIFHVVMAVGYGMAAYDPDEFYRLITFAIIVKTIAAVYLFVYYLLINPLVIVLLSGAIDGLMALAIWVVSRYYQRHTQRQAFP